MLVHAQDSDHPRPLGTALAYAVVNHTTPSIRTASRRHMTVNFKLLKSFTTAVDIGSLSAAATTLHIAQPALSQQIATLESHFKQKLLTRSHAGVLPTAAGRELYRHAQLMLEQIAQAESDVKRCGGQISGTVSVGLATYSTVSTWSTALLKAIRAEHPSIGLFINDNFGLVLSEMVMTGRMDMAILYAPSQALGVSMVPLLEEELVFIAPPDFDMPGHPDNEISLRDLDEVDLLLPGRSHYLRKLIESAFQRQQIQPRVAAEIESAATLREAIESGLGATILPQALVHTFPQDRQPVVRRIQGRALQATVSLCLPEHAQLSAAAAAVKAILLRTVQEKLTVDDFGALACTPAATPLLA
jgi:LysR family nitrogen assimilation transcriptional regulator